MRFQIQTEFEMFSQVADLDLGLDLELEDLHLRLELADVDLDNLKLAKNSGVQSFTEKEKLKTKNSDDLLICQNVYGHKLLLIKYLAAQKN